MLKVGPYSHHSQVIVAPMAGVTDQPFRNLCRKFGAFWLVSEMVTSDTKLWGTEKSKHRLRIHDEKEPRWIQIAGSEPSEMAEAARRNVELGAQIIDINMGCPAKKVCNRLAGSALLRDESLVGRILQAVVKAVDVPWSGLANGLLIIPYLVLNPIFGWKEFSPTARTICNGTYGQ